MRRDFGRLLLLALAIALAGCGSSKIKGDGPGSSRIPDLPGDAVPRQEPRSKYGNGRDLGDGPKYEVWGKTYRVMDSSTDYQERGVASWYGKKFHGRPTSSQETYDMYQMTAAHKSLPLPTYVRVRNLRNNKTIVVRVNDRGPFVNNRIIDLSYAAALKLDMIEDGTSLVEVTAINFDEPLVAASRGVTADSSSQRSGSGEYSAGDRPTSVSSAPRPSLVSTPSVAAAVSDPINPVVSNRIFVQVGAFGDRANATRRLAVLSRAGIQSAFVHEDSSADVSMYRVRIGPVADVVQYDTLVEELEALGITDPYLITE